MGQGNLDAIKVLTRSEWRELKEKVDEADTPTPHKLIVEYITPKFEDILARVREQLGSQTELDLNYTAYVVEFVLNQLDDWRIKNDPHMVD